MLAPATADVAVTVGVMTPTVTIVSFVAVPWSILEVPSEYIVVTSGLVTVCTYGGFSMPDITMETLALAATSSVSVITRLSPESSTVAVCVLVPPTARVPVKT